jgi:hypothetical protein
MIASGRALQVVVDDHVGVGHDDRARLRLAKNGCNRLADTVVVRLLRIDRDDRRQARTNGVLIDSRSAVRR